MAYIYQFGGNKKARSAYCKTRKFYIGGLEGNRTLDLCVANAALSQLSYKPMENAVYGRLSPIPGLFKLPECKHTENRENRKNKKLGDLVDVW